MINKNNISPPYFVMVLFLIALNSCIPKHVNAQTPQWRHEGYGGFYFNSITVTGTGRLIAGTIWDGFFISDDEGVSWVASNNGFEGVDSQFPKLLTTGSKLFAATRTGLFASNDNGNSWSTSGVVDQSVHNLVESGSNIVIATEGTIFYSTDNGTTWLPGTGIDDQFIIVFTQLGASLFAVSGNSVFISNDNGESWSQTNSISPNNLSTYDVVAVGSNLVCATNIGIFRSTDSGTTWVHTDATKRYGKMALINGNLFLGDDDGIYISTDEGVNWTLLDPVVYGITVTQFVESDGNIFVATANGGILFTDDNGITWSTRDSGLINPYINSLAAKGEIFIAATDRGLRLSSDGAKTWTQIPNTSLMNYTSILEAGNKFIAGTDTNGIYISEDDGVTWSAANVGLSELSVKTLSHIDSKIWCGTQNGLFYSTDFGATWVSTNVFGEVSTIAGKNSIIYIMTLQHGMKISTNGGSTWADANTGLPSSFGQSLHLSYMTQLGDKVYFSHGYNGKIYRTNLGSSVWAVFENSEGFGLTTDGMNLFYRLSSNKILANSGLASVSLGYPSHISSNRPLFILPFNSRLYACFNSNLYTGVPASAIYSTSIEGIPGISQLNPPAGKVGSTLTIDGYNLVDSPKRVFFNNTEGTILSSSPTSWTVAIPPTGGDATVKVVAGDFESVLTQKFKIIPELRSITPSEAIVGTRIVIEGTGMDTNTFYEVKYGLYTYGFVKPNSSSRLVTSVPDIDYKGPIALLANGQGTNTECEFIILPRITNFLPREAREGELITISGSGFSSLPGNNKVMFNGTEAITVMSNHKNTLSVIVPSGVASGSISVTTHDRTAYSEFPFVALPLPVDCSWGPVQPAISQVGFYDSTFPILKSSSEGGNSWYLNGELVGNDFGNYLLAIVSGIYTVQVNADGCLSPLSDGFEASVLVTGIMNDVVRIPVEIYPNPVEDELVLNLKSIQNSELVNITIFNQLGIPVYQNSEPGGEVEYINVSHLNTGIYFIKVESTSIHLNNKLIKK